MSSNGTSGGVERTILLGVVIGGAIAVCLVLLRVFGIIIPSWIETILWIVVAVVIGVVAIKFIFKMLRS